MKQSYYQPTASSEREWGEGSGGEACRRVYLVGAQEVGMSGRFITGCVIHFSFGGVNKYSPRLWPISRQVG